MVSIIGGILCLDRVVVQAMISRPIVSAPLIGLILGDPYTGLIAGAFVELFWIDRLPIGAYIPPNDSIVGILITGSCIGTAGFIGNLPDGLIVLAMLLLLPLGNMAQRMELWLIAKNEGLAREALMNGLDGDIRSISKAHLTAMARYYLLSCGFILLALPASTALLTWFYPRLGPVIVRALDVVFTLLPLIGAGVVLNTINMRGMIPIFCAVFLITTAIMSFLKGV